MKFLKPKLWRLSIKADVSAASSATCPKAFGVTIKLLKQKGLFVCLTFWRISFYVQSNKRTSKERLRGYSSLWITRHFCEVFIFLSRSGKRWFRNIIQKSSRSQCHLNWIFFFVELSRSSSASHEDSRRLPIWKHDWIKFPSWFYLLRLMKKRFLKPDFISSQ